MARIPPLAPLPLAALARLRGTEDRIAPPGNGWERMRSAHGPGRRGPGQPDAPPGARRRARRTVRGAPSR